MAAASTVRVTYRSLELAAAAPVSDRAAGLRFVAIDTPPPVRTVLAIAEPGASPVAVEVVEAVEVEAPGVVRGCVVREIDGALLRQPVGSEKLANGAAGGEAPPAREPSGPQAAADGYDDGYTASMAVPAPVVGDADSETSDAIDVRDGEDGDDGDEPSGETDTSASRGKKRRGRKRK